MVYPSTYQSVGNARRDAVLFAEQCGFSPQDVADIGLAVGEACNNAAEHGHVDQGHFKLSCSHDGDDLTVRVHDDGHGFELRGKGERTEPQNRGARGLGIFIMRALMDDVSYDMNECGTTVSLRKHRHPLARRQAPYSTALVDYQRLKASLEVLGKHFSRQRKL